MRCGWPVSPLPAADFRPETEEGDESADSDGA